MVADSLKGLSQIDIAQKKFEIVTTKTFIDRADFQILIGRRRPVTNALFNNLKSVINEELSKNGEMFPYENYLPLSNVLAHLKSIGISKDIIINNYKLLNNLSL